MNFCSLTSTCLSRTLLFSLLTPTTTLTLLVSLHSTPNVILLSPANTVLFALHTTQYVKVGHVPSLKTTRALTSAEAYVQGIRADGSLPASLTLKQILHRNDCPLAITGDLFVDHILAVFAATPDYDGVGVDGLDAVVEEEIRKATEATKQGKGWVLYEDCNEVTEGH